MANTVNPTEKGMLTMFLFDGMSAETGNAISGFFSQFGLPLILIAALIIMFVLSARSNKKRQKQYQSMLDGLKAAAVSARSAASTAPSPPLRAMLSSSASVPTKFALFSQSRQLQASKILPLKQPSTGKSSILPKRDNSQPVSD